MDRPNEISDAAATEPYVVSVRELCLPAPLPASSPTV